MTRFIAASVLIPALLLSTAAAQDVSQAYVQIHGGVFSQSGDEATFDFGNGAQTGTVDFDPDLGFAVGGLVGYDVLLGVSVEAEVTFRTNDIELEDAAAGAPDLELGKEQTVAIMINGVYTFDAPLLADPYVGVGIGYVTPTGDTGDLDGAFAYQAKAGLAWGVGVGQVITEVSYLATDGLRTEDENAIAEIDYGGFGAMVGYRFAF